MQCWACKGELIWGGDQDIEDESEDYAIETNLSCPKCGAFVMVHHGSKGKYKELTEKDLKEWTKK
jgi:ribosomal protein S27AE|tara:strand:+ start:4389 stop:4583 length:195 start_codon:yes stop_codon:yes gene_type:complete